jgi:hypothetical protein
MLHSLRRLRLLTWHVHGNCLYYLTQTPHDFYLVTKPGNPPGYAGKTGVVPWATTSTKSLWTMCPIKNST